MMTHLNNKDDNTQKSNYYIMNNLNLISIQVYNFTSRFILRSIYNLNNNYFYSLNMTNTYLYIKKKKSEMLSFFI